MLYYSIKQLESVGFDKKEIYVAISGDDLKEYEADERVVPIESRIPDAWGRQPIFQTKDGLWKDGFFQKMGKMGMMGKMGFKDGKDGFSKDGKDGFQTIQRWERWVSNHEKDESIQQKYIYL